MSKALGRRGEDLAVSFLIERGFRIVERNFTARMGEIDIVAIKDGVLHFVEVKYSQRAEAHERITPAKLHKLYRTMEYYIQRNRLDLPYQLDALFIENDHFDFVENISF